MILFVPEAGPVPGSQCPVVRWITPTSDNPLSTSCTASAASRKPNTFSVTSIRLALDVVVFRWAVQVSGKLDASRMLVTEKVFGFLLAALAVQLALNGLSDVGVIHLTTGH